MTIGLHASDFEFSFLCCDTSLPNLQFYGVAANFFFCFFYSV